MSEEIVQEITGWELGEEAIESHEYREWFRTLSSLTSFDECVSVGIGLSETASDANFRIGDLANYVVQVAPGIDGDIVSKKTTMSEFSKGIRIDYSRVKEAARVARAVELGVRTSFRGCMYSHFRAMVRYGMVGTDLVKWASEVEDKNLSVKALEGAMHEAIKGEGRDGGKRADDWLAKTGEAAMRLKEEDIRQCYEARDGVIADDILAIQQVLDLFQSFARMEPNREAEAKQRETIRRPASEPTELSDVA